MAVSPRSVAVGVTDAGAGGEDDADRARLHQMGYKQELKRGLSVVSNFAFSFSIISVLTGVTSTYNTGLRYGGPASMTLGWLVVAAFNGCVALSMAEICSAYPTSGGLYYWSAKLAGRKWASLASWVTGWFNIVGQWATATSVDFSLAQLIQVIILLATGGTNGGGYVASKYVVLGIYGFILVLHGLINSLPIHWLSWFGQLGAFWNAAGVFVLVILIPSVAKERSSAEFIFTHLNTDNGMGIHNKAYILGVGLLMSNYCMIGYDTSAHMTEETKNADRSGPIGIVTSVALSNIFGWIYLVTLTSVVTDIPYLLSADNDAGGYAIAQALYTVFNRRYGSGVGGLMCLGVIAVAMFLCGVACITSNSRMGYAFSRDGAMPYSHLWHRVSKHEVPLNVVWLSVLVAFAMALTVRTHVSKTRCRTPSSRLTPHFLASCYLACEVAGEPGGIPGDGVHCDARVVHLLRAAHLLPGDDGPKVIRPRAVSPRQVRGDHRLGRRAVGGLHHRAILAAGGISGGKGRLQLHAGCRRRGAVAQRWLLGVPCSVLVQGTHHER
ncbi:amino-acid permease BAT1 homolog isoform X1 [Hordeum vulgare subsp. vulgare]|uniref:amino-acid permease BAT1 homolog isoform X1 n=1 Tax=Hordeum vulgare subsp. vulgare TaxID=112509 RepID=UPI001D1A5530|nr:amino-acid permease BAT1 homolog isoform X1 [Hordeum vulgare subsp. vulgare]